MTLNPSAIPGTNFDLDDWKLQLPVDANGQFIERYTEVKVLDTYSGSEWFHTGSDGAMVLRAPVEGVTTGGARYARSELRELTDGANAAWTLDKGGYLTVAMQVDELPTKLDGTPAKIVIGQIHGGDHQLVRLYYEKGSIYWVNGRNEAQAVDAVYQFRDSAGNPPKVDLNETFTYSMEVKGHSLTLNLVADGKTYTSSITIGPGWDDNLFYFKAGLYLGTNETTSTGDGQVSIFGLDVTHDGSRPVLDLGGTTPTAPTLPTPVTPPVVTPPVVTPPVVTPPVVTPPIITPPVVAPTIISDLGVVATLAGTSGADVFSVSQKATVVSAGAGIDTVNSSVSWVMSSGVEKLVLTGTAATCGTGTAANDTILGNEAANIIKGNSGNDRLEGKGAADTIKGGSGADHIDGGTANDLLFGDSGVDKLLGGAGNDRLTGGSDADMLAGGEGADVFIFTSVSQSRAGTADLITDFVSGTDKVDLSAIDANTQLLGNQAFTWGGAGAGHLSVRDGHLIADVNGDGRVDVDIDLGGVLGLTSADVLL